jgi:CcmD family protein
MVDPSTAAKVADKLRFLTYALSAIWILLAAYVGLIAWRLRRAETRLHRLESEGETRDGGS